MKVIGFAAIILWLFLITAFSAPVTSPPASPYVDSLSELPAHIAALVGERQNDGYALIILTLIIVAVVALIVAKKLLASAWQDCRNHHKP